ncbi:MAG: hypothetical protein EOM48_11630 [Bacilli bacterium]|nr:hypothetical protein [Bacilli bacterium]
MAWDWKQDWWKVAIGVAAVGAAAFTGGASIGVGAGIIAGTTTAAAAGGLIIASESLENSQAQLDLQQQQYQDQLQSDFNSALSSFDAIKTEFDTLQNVTLPSLESEIKGIETNIDLWDEEYALETGSLEADINSVDDLLENWGNNYDSQTLSAQSQGRSTLNSLLSNWSDAEVAAADRGMGGSMQLIAQQEKSKAVEYAGSDLSLAGNEGIFGSSYASLVANLISEKSQYETQRSLLSQSLDLTKTNLNNQLADWNTGLAEKQSALTWQKTNLQGYYNQLESQYNTALAKQEQLGATDDGTLENYKKLLDEYKQYI